MRKRTVLRVTFYRLNGMRLIERKQWKKIAAKDENKEIAIAIEGGGMKWYMVGE